VQGWPQDRVGETETLQIPKLWPRRVSENHFAQHNVGAKMHEAIHRKLSQGCILSRVEIKRRVKWLIPNEVQKTAGSLDYI